MESDCYKYFFPTKDFSAMVSFTIKICTRLCEESIDDFNTLRLYFCPSRNDKYWKLSLVLV